MTAIAAEPTPVSARTAMRAEHITKVFPGTTALDDVTFDVQEARVNVLVGENGAGKSTLMKIIAGVEQPTDGRLLIDGSRVALPSISVAAEHGIGIIFQELNLCTNLTVLDNLFLAQERTRAGSIDRAAERKIARELLERLGQDIDLDELVVNLRVGQQQIVEIAKALTRDVRVLIMDEPTSALSQAEVHGLFRIIEDLKTRGVSIVYVSHKLEELLQIGDHITVLRDGRIVADAEAATVDVAWIIEQMVGRSPASLFSRREHEPGEVLLRVKDATLPRLGGGYLVDHISLELHAGEILGFYGLMGAGRSELMEVLAGARADASGEVVLGDVELGHASVADRIEAGIVLVPEDRKTDGLVPALSVAHNMVLASLGKYLNGFYLSRTRERTAVEGMIEGLHVRVADPANNIDSLSGGSQQKVVVAKGLLTEPRVLILDEPTRGIDVGAKSEIFEIMSRLASEGYGILFVSSELKEVLAMSDRILVLSKGAIVAEFQGDRVSEEDLVNASAIGHGGAMTAATAAAGTTEVSS